MVVGNHQALDALMAASVEDCMAGVEVERGDAVRHVLKGRRAVAEGVCAWIDRARRELIDEVS